MEKIRREFEEDKEVQKRFDGVVFDYNRDQNVNMVIDINAKKVYPLKTIAAVHFGWVDYVTDVDTLFFLPGEYPMTCAVEYRPVQGEVDVLSVENRIRLEPPMSAILRGGVLGSLLLTVFLGVYRLQGWLRQGQLRANAVLLGLGSVATLVLQFVMGSIVACIVILLLKRSSGLSFPITVDVKDYMGGIVVGLFSYQLGDFLYRKLLQKETPTAPVLPETDS